MNKPKWLIELINVVIGGSLIGLFSIFFLPPVAIKYWWLILPAGLSVTFLAGGFYLVGRGLDEVFNPRLRER